MCVYSCVQSTVQAVGLPFSRGAGGLGAHGSRHGTAHMALTALGRVTLFSVCVSSPAVICVYTMVCGCLI